MKAQTTRLANGVRVVSLRMPHVESVSMGIWARVGARHEPARLNGISHFLEHMLFKGTARRSARRISEEIEGVGGDINANTAEERTCYHAAAPAKYFAKVCDVLFDLYVNPRLAERDIEVERGVIAEEIRMYRDEPDQHVHELLNGICWPGHSLGRPVTGTPASIAGIRRQDFQKYLRSHYHGGNTVVSAAGAVDHAQLVELAACALECLPAGGKPRAVAPPPGTGPDVLFEQRDLGQTHVAIALPGPDFHSPQRHAFYLLNVLLGGNSSSKLFQDLREKRGWCYSVSTYPCMFSDAGVFNISIGLDAKNLEKCLGVVQSHVAAMSREGCKERELRRAREYLLGSGSMALERTGSQNARIAQSLLAYERVIDVEEWRSQMRTVTREDIRRSAHQFLDFQRVRVAAIGPAAAGAALERMFGRVRAVSATGGN